MTELTRALDTSETTLRSIARQMTRALDELHERHEVTAGLTPELKTQEHARVISEHHTAARSVRTHWAQVKNRALAVGEPIPGEPDLSLVDAILGVSDLADARKLTTTLQEA